ncbi:MAG TPA: hypothetical protein VES93_10175 [Ornithinibacter sp.]|nr:hypothetical protein [Ornithinibacter sp.]
MAAATADARVAPLRALADDISRRFPDLGHLGPGGVLRVPVDVGRVTRVRLELPRQFLHLQSIALVTDDGSDAARGAVVTASSWYDGYGEKFDPVRLFDWDHPDGTTVHTEKDRLSWVEVRLATPVRLTEIRIRNVNNATATRAQGVRVVVRTRWRRHVLFDGAARHKALRAVVAAYDLGDADPQVRALVPVLVDTFRGAYPAARKALQHSELDPDLLKAFRGVVNAELLPSRQLLWTIHGPTRSFRFWTPAEQSAYVQFAVEVADALREVTPHVSFGFGAVLSVVRDKALIPHDDDLDVIIGFEPHEAATLADGLAVVTAALEERGFSVRGNYSAHRQIGRNHRGKHVDVFVGLFEGDAISWYPGTRGALDRETMFPTTTAPLLGVECPIPARPEVYLAALYGEGWHTPDPHFAHRWDRSAYADLAGTPPART